MFLGAFNLLHSTPTEGGVPDIIDDYRISFEISKVAGVNQLECPTFKIQNLSGGELLSMNLTSLWKGVSIDAEIGYNDLINGEENRARLFTVGTVLPYGTKLDDSGGVKNTEFAGVGLFDLVDNYEVEVCSQLERLKHKIQSLIEKSDKLTFNNVNYIEVRFGFEGLFEIPEIPKRAKVHFYSQKYKFEGEMLKALIGSLGTSSEI